jgi:hypothetical protein
MHFIFVFLKVNLGEITCKRILVQELLKVCWIVWIFVVSNVFSPSSHCVWAMGSQHVSQVFNVFLNMFPIASHLVSYALLNIVLLELIWICEYWDLFVPMFRMNTHILGSLQSFNFFHDGPIKETHCKNEFLTWKHPSIY